MAFFQEKMVPAEVVAELVGGSYEDLTSRIDEAIEQNRGLFVGEGDDRISRVATFPEKVLVVTEGGKWFEVSHKKEDDSVVLGEAKELEVPTVDMVSPESIRESTMSVVDSLLSEDITVAKENILALADLHERAEAVPQRNFLEDVLNGLAADRPWKLVYNEQVETIRLQVGEQLESIKESRLESKYRPMYETDEIPEEKFEDYRDVVNSDLSVLAHRLESIQHGAEEKYLPFYEQVSTSELEEEEAEVLSHFCFFSEDLIEDLQAMRQTLADALREEQCVMCLGQMYDAIAEALMDYEIAGAFVERMVGEYENAA